MLVLTYSTMMILLLSGITIGEKNLKKSLRKNKKSLDI